MATFDDDTPDLFPATRLSRVEQRLFRSALEIGHIEPEELLFQHSVLCQTGLPYRNPGADVLAWERSQGYVALQVDAGKAFNPDRRQFVQLGLPFGPKPRLILAYLNTQAIRTGSPEIEVDESLTRFVRRIGLHTKGQNIRTIKDQLGRLSAATIRLAVADGDRAVQVNSQIVTAFDLWFPKDERQRVLWPNTVQLSLDYFNSLVKHAVPLDERAVSALSHSAMGLDIYAWLAQRLHRVPKHRAQFVPWTALQAQFGWHYHRIRDFRRVFIQTLDPVLSVYPAANVDLDGRGMTLKNSPPPIAKRMVTVSKR